MKTWIMVAIVVGILAIGTVTAISLNGNVVSEPEQQIVEECPYVEQGGCTQGNNCGSPGCGIEKTGSCGCGR
jgi:hypothetical protein